MSDRCSLFLAAMVVKQEDRKPLTGCLGVTEWGTAVQGSAGPPSGILPNDSTIYISEIRFSTDFLTESVLQLMIINS